MKAFLKELPCISNLKIGLDYTLLQSREALLLMSMGQWGSRCRGKTYGKKKIVSLSTI